MRFSIQPNKPLTLTSVSRCLIARRKVTLVIFHSPFDWTNSFASPKVVSVIVSPRQSHPDTEAQRFR